MTKNYTNLEDIMDNIDQILNEARNSLVIDSSEENEILLKFSSIVWKNLKEKPVIVLNFED